jgi:hypothetical protein
MDMLSPRNHGVLYAAVGVAVGYSGFEEPGGLLTSLLLLVFMIGVLATGVRRTEFAAAADG